VIVTEYRVPVEDSGHRFEVTLEFTSNIFELTP
jgi:hypothetical protein